MQVKEEDVFAMIDALGNHFRANLNNRYLRQAVMTLTLDRTTWNLIEQLTEKSEYYRLQGYHFDELYDRILAMARFVYHARRELQPHLRALLARQGSPSGITLSGNDRVLREMSVNNFASNLNILADMIDKLYQKVVDIDRAHHRASQPAYARVKELQELGRYLVPK
ncbi:MAG: hypothetical protein EA404_12390 [Spirochaetaceae bacterium]|nr:MAG: hypothetical protein EA404_12390 [Spirochaetaceae bacterium]